MVHFDMSVYYFHTIIFRALEEGHLQEAENEKVKLEQYQRERRKKREDEKASYSPQWFM